MAKTSQSQSKVKGPKGTQIQSNEGPQHAEWMEAEEVKMLEELLAWKSEAGDGCSFKKRVYDEVAEALAHLRVTEKVKDGQMIKNKWTKVCNNTSIT